MFEHPIPTFSTIAAASPEAIAICHSGPQITCLTFSPVNLPALSGNWMLAFRFNNGMTAQFIGTPDDVAALAQTASRRHSDAVFIAAVEAGPFPRQHLASLRSSSLLDLVEVLTTTIHDDLPDTDAEDFREDDFDCHPAAPLREALVVVTNYNGPPCQTTYGDAR